MFEQDTIAPDDAQIPLLCDIGDGRRTLSGLITRAWSSWIAFRTLRDIRVRAVNDFEVNATWRVTPSGYFRYEAVPGSDTLQVLGLRLFQLDELHTYPAYSAIRLSLL
jgi:hypothetical protein